MRKRFGIIWKMSREEFSDLVKRSQSIAEILRFFNYSVSGSAHKIVKDRIKEENIDASHIPLGINSNKNRKFKFPRKDKIDLSNILVEGSRYNRSHLKKRLIKDKILEEKCSICNQVPVWNNSKLVMVLDHINGTNNDNRLENLRFLCPNCNSQQETFAGRNKKINI